MLHDLLSRYLAGVETALRQLENAYVERYEEEILAADRINLRIRVRFSGGYLLELNEAAVVESEHIQHLCYRYHFQDKQNNLVFRYDNTPHFPDLESFPNDKHLRDKVVPAEKPSIPKIIQETSLVV